MGEGGLSARAARVLYNAADAWLPPGPDGAPGGGDRDCLAALQARLEPAEAPRLERTLAVLEWSPRLLLHSASGFCWLPRPQRRAWLDRLERLPLARRRLASLRALVEAAWAAELS